MSQATDQNLQRLILEIGMGNDLYGEDYTKAALRAVQDALHHSSLILFRSLDLDSSLMQVRVTIGVEQPESVDCATVAASLARAGRPGGRGASRGSRPAARRRRRRMSCRTPSQA